jgi:hypothetical protein
MMAILRISCLKQLTLNGKTINYFMLASVDKVPIHKFCTRSFEHRPFGYSIDEIKEHF